MKINILFYLFISLFFYNGVLMADSNIITMIVTQNEKVTDPGEVAPEKNCYYRAFT
jgi:hypothetical protein